MTEKRLNHEAIEQFKAIAQVRDTAEEALAVAQSERDKSLSEFIRFLDQNTGATLPLKGEKAIRRMARVNTGWRLEPSQQVIVPRDYVIGEVHMQDKDEWVILITPPNMQEFEWLQVSVADLSFATEDEVAEEHARTSEILDQVSAISGLSDAVARVRSRPINSSGPF